MSNVPIFLGDGPKILLKVALLATKNGMTSPLV
jgi:hypothetical protein